MKSSVHCSFWLGLLFSRQQEHEEELAIHSGVLHFQKEFQSLPQAQETCGQEQEQGWNEGPLVAGTFPS